METGPGCRTSLIRVVGKYSTVGANDLDFSVRSSLEYVRLPSRASEVGGEGASKLEISPWRTARSGKRRGPVPATLRGMSVAIVGLKSGGFPRISVLESDDGSGTGSLRDEVGFAGGDLGLSSTAESSPPLSEKWHLLAPPSHPMCCPRDEGSCPGAPRSPRGPAESPRDIEVSRGRGPRPHK